MTRHARRAPVRSMLLAVACAIVGGSAVAVTPLSPHLTPAARSRLIEQLERAQVPAVGHNSVVIAILSALGPEPRDATFEYDEPYPQLPKVSVAARFRQQGCFAVSAIVDGAPDAGYTRVRVTGTFCSVAPLEWATTDVTAAPAGTR